MLCPKCEVSLMHERDKDDVTLDVCRECGGIWLDRGELQRLLTGAMDAGARKARSRRDYRDDYEREDDRRRRGSPWPGIEDFIGEKEARKLAKKHRKKSYEKHRRPKEKEGLYELIGGIFD